MGTADVSERAREYAARRQIEIDFNTPLGHGQDGNVWKSTRQTAVKVLRRVDNYLRETACYEKFSALGIKKINGFAVPQLIDQDDELLVVEMTFVTPPRILDFGKAWVDERPPFTAEQIEEHLRDLPEYFDHNAPKVRRLIGALSVMGIYYLDAKPGNIEFDE